MKIQIKRAYSRKDATKLSRLDKKIFGINGFNKKDWAGCQCFWIIIDGVTAGSVSVNNLKAENSLYIETIGLLPRFQGKGIGTFVVNWLVEYARERGFKGIKSNVRPSNKPSTNIHLKAGFKIKGEPIKDYYDHPKEDALILELLL